MSERYLITTPIYYVNDLPHIGHIYTTVMADIFARYHRMKGEQVVFLTGTDEHGQKIERSAKAKGVAPIELANEVVRRYETLWKDLEISNDDFIRTTEPRHEAAVAEIIRRIQAAGDIYKGEYTGWYCAGCEAFYVETQLVEGRCPDQGHPVELLSEPSYFFRLSAYRDKLLDWYRDNPGCIQPKSRYNEVVRFVEGGLRDLSISRTSITWGVPFPGDPDHVVYVWLDALTNYISALGFGSDDDTRFREFWPADIHLVGKDILRFHCVYWPAFLMSAGLALPKTIFGHGWWLRDEAKMSKSAGNVVRPDALLKKLGPDPLRYFLAREMTFGADSSFSDEAFLTRYNAELANKLGNTVSRTIAMTHRFAGGRIPAPQASGPIAEAAAIAFTSSIEAMDSLAPQKALDAIWKFLEVLNGFIQERAPWTLAKGGAPERQLLEETLGTCLEGLRIVAMLIAPFMPGIASKISSHLATGLPDVLPEPSELWGGVQVGAPLPPAEPLFPRIDINAYLKESATDDGPAGKPASSPVPPEDQTPKEISIDEFARTRLVVGTVREAELVPKSKKLLRLMVDLGEESPRQIVAGMATKYAPEDLVGRQVVVVANLKPVTLMGVESRGMVLAASEDGEPFILAPDGPVSPGTGVR
ncbi:MAG: methionine--tRNA ligase [Acidobacteria bacterium]|nr:methionine--tRNA ligase [Acidobacteriota bacterium]